MELDPSKTPALRPPNGVVPMFRDYYPVGGSQIALATVLLLLSTSGVVARSYTRAHLMRQFDLSDWSLILALATFTALKLVSNTYGQGHHQWNVNLVNIQHFLLLFLNLMGVMQIENLVETLYCPTMLFAKYTVLRQIEVIFYKHQHKKLASKIIWGLIIANSVFYLSIFITFLLACIPRAKISNPTLEGHCIDTNASILATSVINVVSDFTILIIPLAAVWQLKLRPRVKFGISIVFAVGIFATTACIVRLYYGVRLTLSDDGTWLIEGVGTWAMVEFTTVILVACFPLFPRLYKEFSKHHDDVPFELVDDYRNRKKKSSQKSSHPSSHMEPQTTRFDGGDGSSTRQLFQV
ncbi:hypothetical protein F4861DRAFT_548769 [Xylaria intraflava]|nr:hypothetical protein F4861DRAFT_548769 [Xylaria intraflava]